MKTTNQPITFESNPFKSTFTGFGNFFKYNQTIAIVLLVLSNISLIFQLFGNGGSSSRSTTTTHSSTASSGGFPVAAVVIVVIFVLLIWVVSLLVGALINGMITYAAYKTSKGESTTIAEAFRETKKRFSAIFYAMVISTLKIIGGTLLFIVPGIRASLRYQMVNFPIFDEELNGKQALARIKFLTKDHLLEMFGIVTIASIIAPVAILLQKGGESIMYPQLKALKESNAPKPPVHWLNYLGFILLAFLFILILIGVLIAIAVINNR